MNLEPLRELIERWRKESDDFERDGDEGSAASYYNCADELEGVIAALGEGQEVAPVAPSATAEPFCRDCADNDGICPYSGRACDPNVDPKTALKLMAENAAEIGLTYEYGAPSVMVSRIGDYHAIRREMACVLYDDKKIAECYTNEDAVFVGAAIRAHTSTGHTSEARDALMAARETEDDGAAIMGRLARALAKADPSSKLPRMAIEWLRSKGIHWKSHCHTDPLHNFDEPMTGAGDNDDLPAFLEWVADEVVRRDTRAGNFAEGLAQSLRGRAYILRIVKKDAAMRQKASND